MPSLALKKRAQALVAYAGFAAQRPVGKSHQESMGPVLALLIDIIATGTDADIVKTANASFLRVLNIMSAEEFVKAVSEMLKSDNLQVGVYPGFVTGYPVNIHSRYKLGHWMCSKTA